MKILSRAYRLKFSILFHIKHQTKEITNRMLLWGSLVHASQKGKLMIIKTVLIPAKSYHFSSFSVLLSAKNNVRKHLLLAIALRLIGDLGFKSILIEGGSIWIFANIFTQPIFMPLFLLLLPASCSPNNDKLDTT